MSCVTYGTRRRSQIGALHNLAPGRVLDGIHMRQLDERLEVFITDKDVDENWQLRDPEALMQPYRAQVRTIDGQMVEALEDTQ